MEPFECLDEIFIVSPETAAFYIALEAALRDIEREEMEDSDETLRS